jgi:hypothetical protein
MLLIIIILFVIIFQFWDFNFNYTSDSIILNKIINLYIYITLLNTKVQLNQKIA